MQLTKIKAGSYQRGDWRVLRMDSGSWIVWNLQTQTRTARDCRNTLWFSTFADAKKFVTGTPLSLILAGK
jgi:hypothetical protein